MQNCPDKIVNSFWSWSKKCLEEPKITLSPQMLKLNKFRYMELPEQLKRSHSNVSPVYIWPRTPIKFCHIAFVISRWLVYSGTKNNIWDLHILYLGQRKVVVKRPPGFPFTRSYLASHVLCTQLVVHKKYLCTMYVRNAQCTVHSAHPDQRKENTTRLL